MCGTVGPLLAASVEPLAHRRNIASVVFSIGSTLVGVCQNYLNCFHFFVLAEGPLILIGRMIFLSPFVDVTRLSMQTVSSLTQLYSGILCLWNVFF